MKPERRWDAEHGSLILRRPAPGVLLVIFEGTDVGQFGDARRARAASVDASGAWARWLGKEREYLRGVSMLAPSWSGTSRSSAT